MAPANTSFSFVSPVKGEPLFLPVLEHLQTLYPGAYARGTTAKIEGKEKLHVLSVRTHTGAAGVD